MKEIRLTLIQANTLWESPQENIRRIDDMLNHFEIGDIIVLPEMWTTGFTMNVQEVAESMKGAAVQAMQGWASQYEALVMGTIIIREEGRYRNRCILAYPDGRCLFYDKRHSFSYGSEDKYFTPGKQRVIIEYKGWKIMPQICYDLRFPVWSRQDKNQRYDVLIYMASWPARRIDAWTHLLGARAIENQAYCAGVNRVGLDGYMLYYNGQSNIYDFRGRPLFTLNNREAILTQTLNRDALNRFRTSFPFLDDADDFQLM